MLPADVLEEEVALVIMNLHLPPDWRVESKTSAEGFLQIDQRRREMQQTIERLDFRWDMGFIAKAEYLALRKELQKQVLENQPIVEQELVEAEMILRQFRTDWVAGDLVRRKQLLTTVIESAQVRQSRVDAIKLRPRFAYLAQFTKNVMIDPEGLIVTQVAEQKGSEKQ